MAVFFAILVLIGWGVGDVFVTIAARRVGFLVAYFWGFMIGSVFIIGVMPFMGPMTDMRMFMLAILLNIIHTIGNLSFFRGVQVGNASIVGTIIGAFPMISVITAIIFFNETLNILQLTGVVLAISGILLTSVKLGVIKRISEIVSDKGTIYALVTMICWGIYFAFVRIPAEKIGWYWAGFPLFMIAPILLVSKNLRMNAGKIFQDKKGLWSTVVYALLTLIIADFSYNIGILYGFTAIVVPIAGSSTVLYVLLSRVVFREKLTVQQKVGIISSLVGIVLISFTSS